MMRRLSIWILGPLLIGSLTSCGVDTDEPSFDNPLDPSQGSGLPIPEAISIAVGDNVVELTWSLPAEETADEYAVFRRQTAPVNEAQERLIARTTAATYRDTGVRNGYGYAYRIAAGRAGQFGPRTAEWAAEPGLFAIILAGGGPITNDRTVGVEFYAPTATALQLSEDADAFTDPWYPATGGVPWTLSAGDGEKTLYGRFRLADGSESTPVFDSINLDTQAAIESFAFAGATTRAPGEQITFTLVAGEPHGTATVTVNGLFYDVSLYDDGTHGDGTVDDGTYARTLEIPAATRVLNETVIGDFADEAGNVATSLPAARLLTVRAAPLPVVLLEPHLAEPPDAASVSLCWSLTETEDFSAYCVFRSADAQVDSTDYLLATISSSLTVQFEDHDVTEGEDYAYRVYVRDLQGSVAGSNTVTVTVPNVRAPGPVTIQAQQAVSTSRIALAWSRSADGDFAAYRIYRNQTGAVSEEDTLAGEVTDVEQTYWDDEALRENTTYYYRIYIIDEAGLIARSNEVSVQTSNAAPVAVALYAATGIDSTSAEISWAASTAHDFAAYRLYRDEIATVTTTADLVAELDDASFTAYHDTDLSPGTHYYYRVFVVDDASDPEVVGSNTIDFTTWASTGGQP